LVDFFDFRCILQKIKSLKTGVGDDVRERLNSKKQFNENGNKNSKKVNEILKRLTSYTNQKTSSTLVGEDKSTRTKKNSSTDSSNESNSSSSECDEDYDSPDVPIDKTPTVVKRTYQVNCIKSLDSTDTCDTDDSDSMFSIIRHQPKSTLQTQFSTEDLQPIKKSSKKLKKSRCFMNYDYENENDQSVSDQSTDDELKLPAKRIKLNEKFKGL
jgi:hypothetical protein